jgi:hypothetical protein
MLALNSADCTHLFLIGAAHNLLTYNLLHASESCVIEPAPTTLQSVVLFQNRLLNILDLSSRLLDYDRHRVLSCDKQYFVAEIDLPKFLGF